MKTQIRSYRASYSPTAGFRSISLRNSAGVDFALLTFGPAGIEPPSSSKINGAYNLHYTASDFENVLSLLERAEKIYIEESTMTDSSQAVYSLVTDDEPAGAFSANAEVASPIRKRPTLRPAISG